MSRLHLEPWIDAVLGGDAMGECSVVINGLRFYVPDNTLGQVLTAYERAEACGAWLDLSESAAAEDGLYILTASGESAIADCDLSGLAQVEADIKNAHRQRSGNGKMSPRSEDREETLPW